MRYWFILLMLLWQTLPTWALSPREREENVFARALIKGDILAVETWLAQTRQSAQESIYLHPRLRLRPLSIVLQQTSWEKQEETLRLLLKLGAHFNYQEADLEMKTPLHLALDSPTEHQAHFLIRLILTHHGQSNLSQQDQQGRTPAQYAQQTFPVLGEFLKNFHTFQLSPLSVPYQSIAWLRGEQTLNQLRQEQALFEAVERLQLDQVKTLI